MAVAWLSVNWTPTQLPRNKWITFKKGSFFVCLFSVFVFPTQWNTWTVWLTVAHFVCSRDRETRRSHASELVELEFHLPVWYSGLKGRRHHHPSFTWTQFTCTCILKISCGNCAIRSHCHCKSLFDVRSFSGASEGPQTHHAGVPGRGTRGARGAGGGGGGVAGGVSSGGLQLGDLHPAELCPEGCGGWWAWTRIRTSMEIWRTVTLVTIARPFVALGPPARPPWWNESKEKWVRSESYIYIHSGYPSFC